MIIYLSPTYSEADLTAARQGDTLIINAQPFDFSQLPDGATLPLEAIDSPHFCGPVERIDGKLHIRLILPIQRAVFHGSIPPIMNPPDGPIALPEIKEVTK